MFDDDNMNVSDGDDNGKSPAIENAIATSTTKRSKKQRHSGGSPLTGLPAIRNNMTSYALNFKTCCGQKIGSSMIVACLRKHTATPMARGIEGLLPEVF